MPGPNDSFPRVFAGVPGDSSGSPGGTEPIEVSEQRLLDPTTTRTVRSLPSLVKSQSGSDYMEFSGDGMMDFEHWLTMHGPFQFDGDSGSPPIAMVRVSRDAAGNSRNHSYMGNVTFTGHSRLAHFINDGQELMLVENCMFLQNRNNGCCVEITNRDRTVGTDGFADATNRTVATTSGLIFSNCSFAMEGTMGASSSTAGCSVRIRGAVTELVFDHCWFAGNAPIRVVDDPDEASRANSPLRIYFNNCTPEGLGEVLKIRYYGIASTNIVLTGWSNLAGFFSLVPADT